MDLTSKDSIFGYVRMIKPDTVIHLGALTTINACENNRELAWRTNVEGTLNLVKACEEFSSHVYFVYMSTPCVFFGDRGNYTEIDIPHPKNYYGLTKLVGETVVRASSLTWLIVRGNFVPRVPWPYPKAFVDRFGTYLFADELAKGISEVMEARLTGIVHIVGDRKLSMYQLAKINTPNVLPMTLDEYKGPPLTVDMSLESVRWKKYSLSENRTQTR